MDFKSLARRAKILSSFALALVLPTAHGAEFKSPEIEVHVKLSAKAAAQLGRAHETIVVLTDIYGEPKKNAKVELDEFGWLVRQSKVELSEAGTAKLKAEVFPESIARNMANSNYIVYINVISGRRSSKNNLLNCNPFDGKIVAGQHRDVQISCKLIRGE